MSGLAAPDAQARLDPRTGVKPRELDGRGRLLEEVGDAHRFESVVGLELPVERAQEIVSVVGVLLPGVLAIEDDRGEVRPALVRQAVARAFELHDHVADRVLGFHVAVHEADPVRELSVAEDHGGAVGQAIRPVEKSGLDERADLVAPQLDVHRTREHALVRGEPGEAGLADSVRGLRRHRAFGWPHAAGPHAEGALVRRDRLLELERGVVRICEGDLGELCVGIGPERRSIVDDEREDRVVIGRGQDLDLPIALEAVIEVRDARRHESLATDHVAHVVTSEPRALVGELDQALIGADVVRVDPGEVEPEREIHEVIVREELVPVAGRHRQLEQTPVFVITVDDVAVMDREEPPQDVHALLVSEHPVHCAHREARVLVVGTARVILELIAQARHHREVHLHAGELLKEPRHVQVILRRVEAHPRQHELAGLRVLVVGLVHVPEDRDGQLSVHGARPRSSRRRRTRSGSIERRSHPARGPTGFPMKAR